MALPTLLNSRSPLASPGTQRALLERLPLARAFDAAVEGLPLTALAPAVLQINVGRRCNQACHHCHVDAGPDRTEVMTDDVIDALFTILDALPIPTVDITGGAPELHPRFRELVAEATRRGRHVIDRCNLTITMLPNYADLPEFLAAHRVEVVASLPSYAQSQTDRQRGEGVFESSIAALKRFNALGYGVDGSGLALNLVTNPVGAFLPPAQQSLEAEWKCELERRHGIRFNRLYTITNMPISRYLEWLERSGNLEAYMSRLVAAFNPAAVEGLMCRYTWNVAWDGRFYDCDFNQMLDIGTRGPAPSTVFEMVAALRSGDLEVVDRMRARPIATGPHCFGCTAGAGSSCGGATVK